MPPPINITVPLWLPNVECYFAYDRWTVADYAIFSWLSSRPPFWPFLGFSVAAPAFCLFFCPNFVWLIFYSWHCGYSCLSSSLSLCICVLSSRTPHSRNNPQISFALRQPAALITALWRHLNKQKLFKKASHYPDPGILKKLQMKATLTGCWRWWQDGFSPDRCRCFWRRGRWKGRLAMATH